MASEQLLIEVSMNGGRVVNRDLQSIARNSDSAARSSISLKNALMGITGGIVLRELTGIVNIYAKLQNRLRVVTKGTEELSAATNALFEISQETRSSFENTVELFTRLRLATKDLGQTQEQTLAFTEHLNKAIIVSGATAQEAHNSLVQLSQGLAKGVLNGDELRSVLEQLPMVADVIARKMGVTRGSLKDLGEQGRITSEIILSAFVDSAGAIDKAFAKTILTLPQAFEVLLGSAIKTFGEFDTAHGITMALSKQLVSLARNLPELVAKMNDFRGAVVAATVAYLAFNSALDRTPSILTRLAVALLRNPVVSFGAAIAGGIAYIVTMREELSASATGAATFGDLLSVSLDDFTTRGLPAANKAVIEFGENLEEAIGDSAGNKISDAFRSIQSVTFPEFLQNLARVVDTALNLFTILGQGIGTIVAGFPSIFDRAQIAFNDWITDLTNKTIDFQNKQNGTNFAPTTFKFFEVTPEQEARAKGLGPALAKIVQDGMKGTFTQNLLTEELIKAEEFNLKKPKGGAVTPVQDDGVENKMMTPRMVALAEVNRKLDEQSKFLALGNTEREVENRLYQIKNELLSKGVRLQDGDAELSALRERLNYMQQLTAQGALLDQAFGEDNAFKLQLDALGELSRQAPELATIMRNSVLDANADILEGTVTMQDLIVQKYEDTHRRIEQLQGRNVITAKGAEQAKAKARAEMLDQQVQGTQKFLGDVASLTTAHNKRLSSIGKAAAVAQATIDGVLAVMKAFSHYGPTPAGFAAAAIMATVQANNIAQIKATTPGFANGGSFMVGGGGGTDSQLVQFRASPNERVTIETPAQANAGRGGSYSYTFNIDARDEGAENRIRAMIQDEVLPAMVELSAGKTIATLKRRNLA